MSRFLRYWGPVCAYAAVIFCISSLSHPEEHVPLITHFSDKFIHTVEYAVFGALCYRALRASNPSLWRRQAIPLAVLFASLYGISDELHQSFVPFRESSWLDWVADTLGGTIGAIAMHRVLRLKPVSSIPQALP